MVVWIVLGALAAFWVVRFVLARNAKRSFCGPDGCLTLAIKAPGPSRRDKGWKHGFARLDGDVLEWRAEFKTREGADYTIDRNNLLVRSHRPVKRGEAMLNDRCALVDARHMDEDIQLGILRGDELDRFLAWAK